MLISVDKRQGKETHTNFVKGKREEIVGRLNAWLLAKGRTQQNLTRLLTFILQWVFLCPFFRTENIFYFCMNSPYTNIILHICNRG